MKDFFDLILGLGRTIVMGCSAVVIAIVILVGVVLGIAMTS